MPWRIAINHWNSNDGVHRIYNPDIAPLSLSAHEYENFSVIQ
jgi:hypothetical protein